MIEAHIGELALQEDGCFSGMLISGRVRDILKEYMYPNAGIKLTIGMCNAKEFFFFFGRGGGGHQWDLLYQR